MKLGDVVQISIGVPNLGQSINFYETLGFHQIATNQQPWPWAQFSDGRNLILLNQDGNEYVGLTYFSTEVGEKVAQVEAVGAAILNKQEQDGRIQTAIFGDANGLFVALINHDAAEMPHPTSFPICRCGTFGELAVAVNDLEETGAFWQQFGFTASHVSHEPYPWGIFSDGLIVLGFHQSTEFADKSPALTYFASNMAERIDQVKASGLVFVHEMQDDAGVTHGGTLLGPAGEAIFMFSEGEI